MQLQLGGFVLQQLQVVQIVLRRGNVPYVVAEPFVRKAVVQYSKQQICEEQKLALELQYFVLLRYKQQDQPAREAPLVLVREVHEVLQHELVGAEVGKDERRQVAVEAELRLERGLEELALRPKQLFAWVAEAKLDHRTLLVVEFD